MDYVYAFELRQGDTRVLLAMDELDGWVPSPELTGWDLAILPRGISELDPFTGERRIAADHPVLRIEATFDETLAIVDRLDAQRVVLSHVEEIDGLSHDDLGRLAAEVGRGIEFAYDGMVVEL
jgi:phosphoribosyl 1,2-cyclic phosphate phosphodiesterase